MQCISVHSIQGKATQSSKVAMGPVIELCCVVRPGAVSMYIPVYIQHTYLGLYPTAKASYMYVHGMYSAIQLERFGHMHTLHMLCNIKTKDIPNDTLQAFVRYWLYKLMHFS